MMFLRSVCRRSDARALDIVSDGKGSFPGPLAPRVGTPTIRGGLLVLLSEGEGVE